jgi:hypothetical protein
MLPIKLCQKPALERFGGTPDCLSTATLWLNLFDHGREEVVMFFLIIEDLFEHESGCDILFFCGQINDLLIHPK